MAQILIDIPDDKIGRIRDAFAATYGWSSGLGVTKTVFAKQQLIRYIRETVNDVEMDSRSEELRQTVRADVDSISMT